MSGLMVVAALVFAGVVVWAVQEWWPQPEPQRREPAPLRRCRDCDRIRRDLGLAPDEPLLTEPAEWWPQGDER